MPMNKFICDALKGPYELLKEKYDETNKKLVDVNEILKAFQTIDAENNERVKQLKQQIEQLANELSQ